MTRDEFIDVHKAMGLTQTGLAERLGMSLRQVQGLENGTTELRLIHALAIERVALAFAAASGNWNVAPPSVRRDAMDVVALFRGKEAE